MASSAPASSVDSFLSGRLAVVTGGHRGVGAAISLALGKRGADVIVVDRGGPQDSGVVGALHTLGRQHWSVQVDLEEAASVTEAGEAVQRIAGTRGVDILVNNAGVAHLGKLEALSCTAWDATMSTNVRAPFLLSQALANGENGMLARGCGVIVNVTSVAGTAALKDHAAYCASKAALDMLTKVMAAEWAARGIRANAVAPTVVLTEMGRRAWGSQEKAAPMLARIPAGRFAEPDEVADAVVFLASDAAGMIHGQVLSVDGGYTAA